MPLDRLANLDDLDSWSNLEGLDAYGSIDNLNMFLRFAEANPSIELTTSANESTRTRSMSASVGALGVSAATAVGIKIRIGFAEVVVNSSSLPPFKLAPSSASSELRMYAQSSGYLRALSSVGISQIDISASGNNTNVRQFFGNPEVTIKTDCNEMFKLDSNWANSTDGSEVWAEQIPQNLNPSWTNSTDGSEVWIEILPQNEVWKIKQEGNERWGIK